MDLLWTYSFWGFQACPSRENHDRSGISRFLVRPGGPWEATQPLNHKNTHHAMCGLYSYGPFLSTSNLIYGL